MKKQDQNSRAHDLFLLMFNLSQLTLKEKIIEVFVEALKEIWPDHIITYYQTTSGKEENIIKEEENIIKIYASGSSYGYLLFDNLSDLENEDIDLLHNAVAMLAVVLKKNEQDKLLADEKLLLQELVDESLGVIKESEEKFRSVFEHSVLGKSLTTIDGKLKTNKAFCQILGYSEDELSKLKWQEITHRDDIERDQKTIDSLISGEKLSACWEKRYIHKNGNIVWVDISTSLLRNDEGSPLYFITSINETTNRKQAERELLEKEFQYRNLANSGLALIWTSGTDKLCNYFNEPWLKFTGRTLQQEMGNGWTEGVHPDDIDKCFKTYLNAFEKHEILDMEYRLRHATGEYRWIRDFGTPNYNSNGEFIGYIGHCFDITGNKMAEEALKASDSLLNSVIHQSPYPMWISDDRGTLIKINRACLDMLCITEDEVIGKYNIFHDNLVEQQGLVPLVKSVFEESKTVNFEIIYNTSLLRNIELKDKTFVILDTTIFPVRNEDGIMTNAVIQHLDISARKKAEKALLERERQLSSIYGTVGDVIFLLAVEAEGSYRFASVNPAFYIVTGINEEMLVGKLVNDVIAEPSLSLVLGKYKQAIKENKIIRWEETTDYPAGRLTGDVSIAPVVDDKGQCTHLVGSVHDITDRKIAESKIKMLNEELEQRVIQRTAQLEAANKELEAFSYSVSHDLRAPLRSIHSFTNILKEEYHDKLDEEAKRLFGIVSSSVTRMGELIDDLLSFSRIGKSNMNPELLDMESIAGGVYTEMTGGKEKESKRINFKIGKLHKGFGDAHLMRQVWNNLISNAIKYSSKTEHPEIAIGSRLEGDTVTYFVNDNGVGFDMQYKDKLFGVFQRLHSDSEFEGSGVGLANIQRIVLRHNGSVWAEGEVGKGATFYFSLPVQEKK
jgi:PAS domain S-box-containing protein